MRKNAFLMLLPLVLLCAFGCETNDSLTEPEAAPISLNAGPTSCTTGFSGGTGWTSSNSSHGNSFTACMDGVVTGIALEYGTGSDPNATGLTLSLFNGNTVSGTAAYTQSGVTLAGTYDLDLITLTTPFPVTNGSQYTFDIDAPSPVGHACGLGGGAGNGQSAYFNGTEAPLCNVVHTVHIAPGIQPITVEIDIKPGSDPSCLNNDGHGVIPVAILSSGTFDASTVDPGSVALEGMQVSVRGKSNKLMAHAEDVNGDGLIDLVVQIEDVDGTFTSGQDFSATLTGVTFDGTPIEGTGDICVVPDP